MIFQLMPANNVARHSNVENTRGNSPLEWQATWRSTFLQPEKSDAVQNNMDAELQLDDAAFFEGLIGSEHDTEAIHGIGHVIAEIEVFLDGL
ncbi:MAG: hypothetical protein ACI9DF_004162 [Verrucomicrobiales bacterium]|jgi:hypothetical protein